MAAEPQSPSEPRTETFRFLHATGARPLDGFTIKRGIGVGGFGEVYYALSDAGKEVALKRIQRHLDVELRGVRQCLNLKQQNLLSLFDIRYDDHGEAWVIMEYMLGDSLRDVLDRNQGGLSRGEVQRWFTGVAAGVAYLHDHGIVHRDLKPGNIFDDQGIVKLGDYGLSKFISCSRRSGQTESVGTFHYMAPEIGRGSYGKEIDVYALGIILYELLTGRVPYEGESSQEIIMKHLTADPDLSAVPVEYREPIRRALLKDPQQRYRSVGEMLAALRWPLAQSVVPTSASPDRPAVPATADGKSEPFYVGDDATEIVFGPVRDVVDAQVVTAVGARPAGAAVPPAAPASSGAFWEREPIAMAARDLCKRGWTWWQQSNLGLPIKIVILVAVGLALLSHSHMLIPAMIALGIVYLVYFGVWALTYSGDSPTPPAPAASAAARATCGPGPMPQPVAVAAAPASPFKPAKAKRKIKQADLLRPLLARQTTTERTADLIGSLLMSFVVNGVLGILALLIGGKQLTSSLDTWSLYAWMLGMSTVMSWTVLTLGKLWETRAGDVAHRRFVMLMAGLLVGGAAFGANLFLGEPLRGLPLRAPERPFAQLYTGSEPLVSAWLVHFGVLMFGLRWWRQTDPLRSTRLSLWSVAVCGAAAGLLQTMLPLYGPWVVLPGIVSAVSIQLAAPWVHPQQRIQMSAEVSNVA